jgi:hypothetical protein
LSLLLPAIIYGQRGGIAEPAYASGAKRAEREEAQRAAPRETPQRQCLRQAIEVHVVHRRSPVSKT